MRALGKSITSEDFRMLLHCYRAGDESALTPLVMGMRRRIHNAAWPWFSVVDWEELVQEGISAFLEFLPVLTLDNRSAPITYVMLRVRGRLRDYVLKACPITRQRGRHWKTSKTDIVAWGVSLGSPGDSERVLYGSEQ